MEDGGWADVGADEGKMRRGRAMNGFNDRRAGSFGRRHRQGDQNSMAHHILEEFPEPPLEAIVIQWERLPPTVLVQLKRDPP